MEGYPVMQMVEFRVPRQPQRFPLHSGVKKYVFLCSVCGGLASLLGTLFLAVYLILRTYTSSLDYFETIPTYIPAAMLMVTGLAVMCLARRRNRYIFLIKLCGLCCLMCVGTCVLVTVTTTVVHMSRLQSLRECVYTAKTQTCTCYSVLLESASERSDEGSRYVFNATPDCEAIHGALYSCLRALFGLSVIGILVCIFCCMLVYQLLSHERKKMYWEQLELRCHYLYGQASNPVRNPTLGHTPNIQPTQHCACCQQFRYHQDILTWEASDNRFWSGAQVGNLYSPNPVGEDCNGLSTVPATTSGWSWRRLPWSRQPPPPSSESHRSSNSYHQPLTCSSPDSQYGFNCEQGRVATVSSGAASYTTIDPLPGPCHVYHWGPPPPYSDPNSPTRSVVCPPGPHHHHCQQPANYVNTNTSDGDNDSCCMLQLRRRPDLPHSSSSSSSMKSNAIQAPNEDNQLRQDLKPLEDNNWRDCGVSPRIKYLRNKLQNSSVIPTRKPQTQELSESEVYFADVSSCNVSVRNDSMSIYGDAIDTKLAEKISAVSDECRENSSVDSLKHQPRSSPSGDDKGPCLPMMRPPHDIPRSDNITRTKDINGFQRVSSINEFPYPGVVLDGSEEDDPELVNFSQRQASVKERIPHYRNDSSTKNKNEGEQEFTDLSLKSQTEFPSPMSISSPSTVSKDPGGFYSEVVNSDNGSLDSVWSGYSPDHLAPDAQYEIIPEHRLASPEDLNGNLNEEGCGNHTRLKMYMLSKKRQYPQMIGGNWAINNLVCNNSQVLLESQKLNINSQKNEDRSKNVVHKTPRPNEQCLADMLNSPKPNYKNSRHKQISSSHMLQNFSPSRHNEFPPPLCDPSNVGGLYYTISENDNICCARTNLNSYDLMCNEKTETLNTKHEVKSALERGKLTNSNVGASESSECFHLNSSSTTELPDSSLSTVTPVDV